MLEIYQQRRMISCRSGQRLSKMMLIGRDETTQTVILQSFSWRALLFVYLLPSLVALFGLFAVPESPKFQFHIGKLEECMNTLKKMYAINTGDPTLKFPCKLFQKQDSDTTDNNINIKRLFQKPLLLQTILLCSIAFIMSMAGGGLYMWTPTVFNAIDYFQNKTVCEALIDLDEKVTPNSSSFLMMMISMSFLVFFTLTSSVIKKVGKKLVLVFWFLVSISSCGLLYFVANISVVVMLFSLSIQSANLIGIVNGIAADYFPTGINAMAVSLVTIFSRLGVSVGSNIVGYFIIQSCENLILGFCGILTIAVFLLILLK